MTGFVLQGHIYSSKEPEMMRCFADFKHAVLRSDSVCMCHQVCADLMFKSGPISYKTLWRKINKILFSCVLNLLFWFYFVLKSAILQFRPTEDLCQDLGWCAEFPVIYGGRCQISNQ